MKKVAIALIFGLALGATILWGVTEIEGAGVIILFILGMLVIGYVVGRLLRFFLQRGAAKTEKAAKPAKARKRGKRAKRGKR